MFVIKIVDMDGNLIVSRLEMQILLQRMLHLIGVHHSDYCVVCIGFAFCLINLKFAAMCTDLYFINTISFYYNLLVLPLNSLIEDNKTRVIIILISYHIKHLPTSNTVYVNNCDVGCSVATSAEQAPVWVLSFAFLLAVVTLGSFWNLHTCR
jgi:hypothetical protein